MLRYALVIMAIATIAMAQSPAVVDTEGQPLRAGLKYYVLPAATDTAGGLTLINRTSSGPLYVAQQPLATVVSQGLPVTFTPVSTRESLIREGSDFSLGFSGRKWRIGDEDLETSRRFIVVGGRNDVFRIDNNGGLYSLGWCPSCNQPNCGRPRCGSVGVLVRDGKRLLALDGPAFPFRFQRA